MKMSMKLRSRRSSLSTFSCLAISRPSCSFTRPSSAVWARNLWSSPADWRAALWARRRYQRMPGRQRPAKTRIERTSSSKRDPDAGWGQSGRAANHGGDTAHRQGRWQDTGAGFAALNGHRYRVLWANVGHRLAIDSAAEHGDELGKRNGFGNVVVHAGGEARFAVSLH